MLSALKSRVYGLLRWSERYTKLDMVYLASGSFWITFGQVISNILSLVLLVAFANLLPKETYGLYRYILSLAGILGIFSLTGMNSAVARAVAVGEEGALRASVRYQLKWNLLMFGAFLILSGYYYLQGDILFALSFLLFGLFTPATLAFNTYGAYLEGKKEFMLASLSTIFSTTLYTTGMLAILWYSGEVLLLIAGYTGLIFVSTLFFYFYVLRRFHPPRSTKGDVLHYGRNLTLIGFISPIAAQVDKIIIAKFWGPAELAVYTLAIAIPDKATLFLKNIAGIGSPKFAQKTPAEINSVFYTRVLQGMAAGFICFVGYYLLAPHLFTLILPQYLSSLPYSQFAALTLIFAIPNRYISLLLVAQKLPKIIFWNNTGQSILRIALFAVSGFAGGVAGLVVALVLMSMVGMFVNIVTWRRSST